MTADVVAVCSEPKWTGQSEGRAVAVWRRAVAAKRPHTAVPGPQSGEGWHASVFWRARLPACMSLRLVLGYLALCVCACVCAVPNMFACMHMQAPVCACEGEIVGVEGGLSLHMCEKDNSVLCVCMQGCICTADVFLVVYICVMYGYCWLTKLFLQQDAERTKWSKNRPESSKQSSQGYHHSCLRDEWSGPGWEFCSLTAEEQHSERRGGNSAGHIARVSSSPVTCAATMQLLASCPLIV